jgi:hypothetical protein
MTPGTGTIRKWGRLSRWLVAAGLSGVAGLSGCCTWHVVEPPPPELVASCRSIPQEAREHVHIFFMHGVDFCDWANLGGVRQYLADLGFLQSHVGQWYHLTHAIEDMKQVHREDPQAKFVLVGFSLGANMVSTITRCVKEAGIEVEVLVYCGGNSLMNKSRDQPDNARHIVNILATGWFFNGSQMDRAENIDVPDVFHYGSPSHPRTVSLLVHHLTAIAASCPYTVVDRKEEPLEMGPTPQPISLPEVEAKRDEWDFLKPSKELATLPADPNAKPPETGRRGFFGPRSLALILSGK